MVDKLVTQDTLKCDFSKGNIMKRFEEYNEAVIRQCPSEKLLVFDVKQGTEVSTIQEKCFHNTYYISLSHTPSYHPLFVRVGAVMQVFE
jgi:hypothetical protein